MKFKLQVNGNFEGILYADDLEQAQNIVDEIFPNTDMTITPINNEEEFYNLQAELEIENTCPYCGCMTSMYITSESSIIYCEVCERIIED